MAKKTIYQCDRCYITESVEPDHWIKIRKLGIHKPGDLSAILSESFSPDNVIELCTGCAAKFEIWMSNAKE